MKTRTKWKLLAGGATVLASYFSRKAVAHTWSEPAPPDDPELNETGLGRALMYSAAVAGFAGAARLVARRAAAGAWRWKRNEAPPTSA